MSEPRPSSVGPLPGAGRALVVLALLAAVVIAGTACGQKGPLVLLEPPAPAASAPSR